MKFFVKAKYAPRELDGKTVTPEVKQRFTDREAAFTFIAFALEDGAKSVVIRPDDE